MQDSPGPLFENYYKSTSSPRERFTAFDEEHPEVFVLFCRFTKEAAAAGRRKFGARLITERIRWHYFVSKDATEDFKLNNDYTPFYVRRFLKLHPEYTGIFELRRSVADE